MKQTGISRRDVLKLMSIGVGGVALNRLLPPLAAFAQDSVYGEDIALSAAEGLQVRAANLRIAINLDQATTDYSQGIVYSARRVATQYGITLDVNNAASNVSVQAASMTAQVRLAYDGIFTLALDTQALAGALEQANQARIPVVMTGGLPPRGQLLARVNSTNYLGCYQAAGAVAQAIGGTGKIAVISSGQDLSIYRDGERGVLQAIGESSLQLVDMVAAVSEANATKAAAALLKTYPDLVAIFCTWGEAVDGALSAVSAANSAVKVAGFGAEVATFRAFDADNAALVAVAGERANVLGRAAVNVLCKGFLGVPVASEVLVPTVMVDGTNYRDRWIEMYPNLRAPWETGNAAS